MAVDLRRHPGPAEGRARRRPAARLRPARRRRPRGTRHGPRWRTARLRQPLHSAPARRRERLHVDRVPGRPDHPQHNEMSYADSWPATLFLTCLVPAATGGETPVADSARVHARLPQATRERFERHGVMYVRNFGHGMDLSWQEVFQTQDRAEVDAYCARHGIEAQWLGGERLRTRHVVQATLKARATGERVWFNQAHLFHVSSLPAHVESELRADFAEDELPRNALYGDGTPLDPEDLAHVRAAYAAEEIALPWQAGDVMIVDNEQFSHGRNPYSGDRRVLVAMA
ncbi:TauD/TfdA family dioxygenase [Streptomyces cirratus]